MLGSDWRQLLPTVAVVVIGLAVSLAAGASVVVALNPTLIAQSMRPADAAAPRSQPTPPIVATPRVTPTLLALALGAPTMIPPPQPVPSPTLVLEPAPSSTPTPELTIGVAPTAVPLVESAWNATQPQLDALWGNDSADTVALLDQFHTRFPDFEPATSKLYAALLATANDLAKQGATDAAAAQLGRAIDLLPERPEARAALVDLTAVTATEAANSEPPPLPEQDAQDAAAAPTPQPAVDAAPAAVVAVPARPTPVRVAPPAAVRAAPPPQAVQVAPTPTKVPFVPRGTP